MTLYAFFLSMALESALPFEPLSFSHLQTQAKPTPITGHQNLVFSIVLKHQTIGRQLKIS